MNYTELVDAINGITEDGFPTDLVDLFIRQAEKLIYSTVDLAVMRENQTGTFTASSPYLTLPPRFLYPYSIAVLLNGTYRYLRLKDVSFIREAYPDPTDSSVPKYYGQFDEDTFIVGPTPDSNYIVELHYAAYPASIVDATTTWLGAEFDDALLSGALMQAARAQKADEDVIKMYETQYAQSITLLKLFASGKTQGDTYRHGLPKMKVK